MIKIPKRYFRMRDLKYTKAWKKARWKRKRKRQWERVKRRVLGSQEYKLKWRSYTAGRKENNLMEM